MVKKFISHRANLYKKDSDRENKIEAIYEVIDVGFDCEIDVWNHDNQLYLGHDKPIDKISITNILDIKQNLWIHCKNLEALSFFINQKDKDLNYFWHQEDNFTLTSLNFIWTYPNKELSPNSIIVDLLHTTKLNKKVFGICSDNIYHAKKLYE